MTFIIQDMKATKLFSFSLCLSLSLALGAKDLNKSVTWENIRMHPAPLPVIGEIQARPSVLDAPSMWSVGAETMDRDYAIFGEFRQYMKETGVGYARLQSGWAKTEQKKGRYDFKWLDEHVDGLIEEGIRPWMCLCYGNPIYSKHGHDLNAKLFPDGPIMEAWLKYVKATVAHYKGKIALWEVWNEPDGRKNLDSYPLYANLFVRTAKAIKEVDPDAKIAAFGSCSPDREYIRQTLELIDKAGGIQYIDYITYHAYWPVPETIIPAVRQLRADVDKYDPSIGLIQGETGCPAQLEYGHALKNLEWTEYSQAKWDLRQAMTHWSMGIPYSFFTMVDLNYGWMLQSFGLIRMNGNKQAVYKRPKYYAVQHVTSFFTPDVKPTDAVKITSSEDVVFKGIQKDGQPVGFLVWKGGERPSPSLERVVCEIKAEGLQLKHPVYVDLLTGYVHALPDGLSKVPVWDSPVAVVEEDIVQKTSTQQVRIGSYNLRRAEIAEKNPENNWDRRKYRTVQSILSCNFDICGLQEVDIIQQENVLAMLESAGKPYDGFFFCPYADDGRGSKAHGIIWRKDRFILEGEPHRFWLSDPPQQKQVNDHGPNGQKKYIRGASCATLRDIRDGRRYFIMATHAPLNKEDHAAAAHICADMERLYNPEGYPSFFVGDFNALETDASSAEYRKWWADVYHAFDSAKELRTGPEGTFNGWRLGRTPTKRIDFIYFRGAGVTPVSYRCDDTLYDGLLPSDHFPIYADFLVGPGR